MRQGLDEGRIKMTNKELKQSIKNELKMHGYDAKAVSVSVRDCGYSASVRIEIKSPQVSRREIQKIVNHYEEYERDTRTGEILEGANVYIFVEYASNLFDEVAREWAATAQGVLKSEEEVTRIFEGLYLINPEQSGKLQIHQQNSCEHCTFNVNDFDQLCEFIYKFATFGSIAA